VGGGIFSTIFSIFGVFSILAAILLIVLIFVMLVAERRVEIGISRAVGVQRSQIVQSFMAEGMVYNLLAAALGVLLGIAITFAMTQFIGRLFNDLTGTINAQAGGIFAVSFAMSWESIIVAYCAGVLITWLAMTLSSWRVTRMNVATAIRGLSDEAEAKRRSWLANGWSWLWPLVVLGVGGYLLVQALAANSLSLIMIAATVLLYGATVLVGRILELTPMRNETGYRIVYSLLGVGLLHDLDAALVHTGAAVVPGSLLLGSDAGADGLHHRRPDDHYRRHPGDHVQRQRAQRHPRRHLGFRAVAAPGAAHGDCLPAQQPLPHRHDDGALCHDHGDGGGDGRRHQHHAVVDAPRRPPDRRLRHSSLADAAQLLQPGGGFSDGAGSIDRRPGDSRRWRRSG
jgi:hypothetical protein